MVYIRSTHRTARRHIPFLTFALGSLAAGAYVVFQMIQIVTHH